MSFSTSALKLGLAANAIGKDYRPLASSLGVSPSGAGIQASLRGLFDISLGLQEGVEFNLLGLNFGLDLNRPALRLPVLGRLGWDDTTATDSRAEAKPSAPSPGPGVSVVKEEGR